MTSPARWPGPPGGALALVVLALGGAALGAGLAAVVGRLGRRRTVRRRWAALLPGLPADGRSGAAVPARVRASALGVLGGGALVLAPHRGVGVATALGAVAGGWLVTGPLLPLLDRSRRRPARDPPGLAAVLDLLAACLAAGCPVVEALGETARACTSQVAVPLAGVATALRAGLPARQAWATALPQAPPPALATLARACVRSESGGTPLEALVTALAADLRADAAVRAVAAAQRAGVLAVLPLGLCFLPAYVLLGVVPAVAGLLTRLH